MQLKIFSIFDIQAGVFAKPVFDVSRGSTIRALSDMVNSSQDSVYSKHPADFILFELGSFDDVSGKFSMYDVPERVAGLLDYVVSKTV